MSYQSMFPTHNLFPKDHVYHVALFVPKQTRSVKLFIESFNTHLRKSYQLTCATDVYHLGDEEALSAQLDQIKYDVVICLDDECTTKARQLVAQAKNEVPLIFSSVNDATRNMPTSEQRITGISTPLPDYAAQMILVLSYTPEISTILVIQDQKDSLMQHISRTLVPLLRTHGYKVATLPTKPQLTRQEIVEIGKHDMVILLSQYTDDDYIQRLSTVCKEHKTVLYITDTTSVAHGAAFGFGKDDVSMAYHAASLTHQIVTTQTMPEVTAVPYSLKINLQALDDQGLRLIKIAPLLSLVNTARVVTPTTKEKVSAYLRLEQVPLE